MPDRDRSCDRDILLCGRWLSCCVVCFACQLVAVFGVERFGHRNLCLIKADAMVVLRL
jgi:hypothetical protein